jgi:dethiobiotin synthetase
MKLKNLYVAATSQHVGKTTSTLGIASGFKKANINTGYCKPVGQRHIELKGSVVDKDAVLFADLLKLDIEPAIHSPVIIGKGATTQFLEHPDEYDLEQLIRNASESLSESHDAVIYEGTGHPGVGSVANVSNADVAKLLDARVVMVVEGGIGNTIDRLNMSMGLFREANVPIIGVIINKVIPDKMDMVKEYVGKWLDRKNLKLLGVVPYDNTLGYPLLWTISNSINGIFEFYSERGFNKIENILPGSIVDPSLLQKSSHNLLVVSSRVLGKAINTVKEISESSGLEKTPLSGIIVTGEGNVSKVCKQYIEEHNIPVVRTMLDTYGVVIKISKLEVKIIRRTPWKISKAIEIINDNVDIKEMIRLLRI